MQGRAIMWPLQWRHNGRDSVSNHQPRDCLLSRLFRRKSKKSSKLRVTDLCVGNSPGTGEFPAQMASNTENARIWWCHHAISAYDNAMWPYSYDCCLVETAICLATYSLFWPEAKPYHNMLLLGLVQPSPPIGTTMLTISSDTQITVSSVNESFVI